MKILILGNKGQLGSDLTKALSANSSYTTLTTDSDEVNFENPNELEELFNHLDKVDYVINCAAWTNTNLCEQNPSRAFLINANSLNPISKYCNKHSIPLIHFSTDYVFDGEKTTPYCETDLVNPINVYGSSKLKGEQYIIANHNQYYILRIASVFGAQGIGGKGTNIIDTIVTKARESHEIKFVTDQVISPTYTQEVVKCVLKILETPDFEYGIYHFTCQGACTYFELANKVVELLGLKNVKVLPISSKDFPSAIKRPRYCAISTEKISKLYSPKRWEDALHDYLKEKGYL